jgi:hypothetical protein
MTGAVLRDPLLVGAMLVGASAQHAEDDITNRAEKKLWCVSPYTGNRGLSSKRKLERTVSTYSPLRTHKYTSRPRQFAQLCKAPTNWKALTNLRENFLSYKRRLR